MALLPLPLLAAEANTVRAVFVRGKSRSVLAHDPRKLSAMGGATLLTAPLVTSRTGQITEIAIARDLYVRSVAPGKNPLVPTGVVLRLASLLTRRGIAYRAHITMRECESQTRRGSPSVATFASREIYASGTPKLGEEVWLDLPARDGRAMAVKSFGLSTEALHFAGVLKVSQPSTVNSPCMPHANLSGCSRPYFAPVGWFV